MWYYKMRNLPKSLDNILILWSLHELYSVFVFKKLKLDQKKIIPCNIGLNIIMNLEIIIKCLKRYGIDK